MVRSGEQAHEVLIAESSRHLTRSKPDRSFSRDKQAYRKKSRGLLRKKRGRPRVKTYKTTPLPPEAETNLLGELVLNG